MRRDTILCHPSGMKERMAFLSSGGIVALNPRLISAYPSGMKKMDADYWRDITSLNPRLISAYPSGMKKIDADYCHGIGSLNLGNDYPAPVFPS